jgi:hypothetical protein
VINLPITGVGAFIGFLVLAFFAYRLNNKKNDENKLYPYFYKFSLFFSFFYLLFSLPIIFAPQNSSLIGLGYLIGHLFAYIAFAYLVKIIFFIGFPEKKSDVFFKGYLLLGLFITVLNAVYFNRPEVLEGGLVDWNQNPIVAIVIILATVIVFIPAAFIFFREAIKNAQNRTRYLLISISLFLIIVGGPLHDVAKTTQMMIVADIVTTSGFLFMLGGVLYKYEPIKAKKTKELQEI